MEKLITIPEAKWKRIESFMSMLEKHFTGKLHTVEWMTEALFMEKTEYTTKEKLRTFRNNYPELWKAKITGKQDSKGRNVNRGFMYNYTGYLLLFKSPLDASDAVDLRA